MISLVAMDAQAEIASADGLRRVPILSLFAGPGKSTLISDREILVGFYLPLRKPTQGSAFSRVMRPQGVALPILNLAVWIERSASMEDRVSDIRIAVGPSGPTPQRARIAEDCIKGMKFSDETLAEVQSTLSESLRFRTSPRRSTAEYRHHLSGSLF
jgi:carbon-monoxide dehydrogenase medium subunit